MDIILFFILSVTSVFFLFLFGYSRSQLWHVGYSSLTTNQIWAPALGAQSHSTRTTYLFSLSLFLMVLQSFYNVTLFSAVQ